MQAHIAQRCEAERAATKTFSTLIPFRKSGWENRSGDASGSTRQVLIPFRKSGWENTVIAIAAVVIPGLNPLQEIGVGKPDREHTTRKHVAS